MKYCNRLFAILLQCTLGWTVLWNASPVNAQDVVTAEAVPSNTTPTMGSTITVDITIDVSGTSPAKRLGSFTGSLKWNPEILRLMGHSGIKAPFTGVVNTTSSQASFNGANPAGASGKSNVLTLTFTVNGANTALDLDFTAMLSALDFTNLLPILTIKDGTILTAVEAPQHTTLLPTEFSLGQNFPNPFNSSAARSQQSPATEITYELPRESQVRLTIFNLMGQKVKTLINDKIAAGRHTVRWDGKDEAGRSLVSGVYIYRLEAAGNVYHRRMTLLQ